MAVSPPPQAPPTRLLVVEDDDTIRETIAEALSSEGFEVDAVGSGSTALERFKGSPDNPPVIWSYWT